MTRFAAGLFAVAAAIGTAQAEELSPMQAKSIELGDLAGVAYYTVAEAGYQLVATLYAGEAGTPLRVEAMLADGETIVLSVPRSVGEEPRALGIARLGDAVFVSDARALTN